MIVVDTTVWADWFNGRETVEGRRLDQALADEEAGLTPMILTEVLQGFRADSDFDRARAVLMRLPVLELDVDGHVAAAGLFRRLRRRGVTVRGAVDCVIAETCIVAGAELLQTGAAATSLPSPGIRRCRLCPSVGTERRTAPR